MTINSLDERLCSHYERRRTQKLGPIAKCAVSRGGGMLARVWLLRVTFLSFIASGPTFGGAVTIENPKSLPVNAGQVNVLYTMTCQEIAEAYHIPNYRELEVPLTLVLGEDDERYVIDHLTGAGTVYLRKWTEQNFVAAAVMIAFHPSCPLIDLTWRWQEY